MTISRYPLLEAVFPLVDLQIHQIAKKTFHYHASAVFPYNLLITVLSRKDRARDYFFNCESEEKTPLRAGHAYILPCRLPIRFERTPDCTVVTMRFNLTFFHGLDVFDGMRRIEDVNAPGFAALLRRVLGSETPDRIRTALTIKTEVARLCLALWPEHLTRLTPAMWCHEAAFLFIEKRADATTTVDDLAGRCGMRRDVFSRCFTRDVGISPKRYMNDVMVRRISAYLLTSQLSIKEIADKLNFSSQYYLSRFFKKQTRMAPRDYRKLLLSEETHRIPNHS